MVAEIEKNRIKDDIVVACFDGVESRYCNVRAAILFSQTEHVIEVLRDLISSEKLVILVASSFLGARRLLKEIEEEELNPYLVEFASITESIISGLTVDQIILYHYGMGLLTLEERKKARRVQPPISRREFLRRVFLPPTRYVIQPSITRKCVDDEKVCPYRALKHGALDANKCRGCMYCVTRYGCGYNPTWTSRKILAYLYEYVSRYSIDGLLVTCRYHLDGLVDHAAEAAPAKLLLLEVPCISWLNARLLKVLAEKLQLPVFIYLDTSICDECWLSRARELAVKWLKENGIPVISELSMASSISGRGYSRISVRAEEVVDLFSEEG